MVIQWESYKNPPPCALAGRNRCLQDIAGGGLTYGLGHFLMTRRYRWYAQLNHSPKTMVGSIIVLGLSYLDAELYVHRCVDRQRRAETGDFQQDPAALQAALGAKSSER
eukprot:gb/GEZN01012857.1/.p1 GENE.gb/GEZN01012857.1/~~gb/GEZN01012857.1/.p1  ORF type:complete len:109 (-),score=8.15 gb/GEZN01012857.1/:625-951(-)